MSTEKGIIPQKFFEDLTKKERKLLLKEFNKTVDDNVKIIRWSGISLLLFAIIDGIYAMYYMLNILFTKVLSFQFFICSVLFTLGCLGALLLTARYEKEFRKWLKENKNIISRTNIDSKN